MFSVRKKQGSDIMIPSITLPRVSYHWNNDEATGTHSSRSSNHDNELGLQVEPSTEAQAGEGIFDLPEDIWMGEAGLQTVHCDGRAPQATHKVGITRMFLPIILTSVSTGSRTRPNSLDPAEQE